MRILRCIPAMLSLALSIAAIAIAIADHSAIEARVVELQVRLMRFTILKPIPESVLQPNTDIPFEGTYTVDVPNGKYLWIVEYYSDKYYIPSSQFPADELAKTWSQILRSFSSGKYLVCFCVADRKANLEMIEWEKKRNAGDYDGIPKLPPGIKILQTAEYTISGNPK